MGLRGLHDQVLRKYMQPLQSQPQPRDICYSAIRTSPKVETLPLFTFRVGQVTKKRANDVQAIRDFSVPKLNLYAIDVRDTREERVTPREGKL